jgi:putative transposase
MRRRRENEAARYDLGYIDLDACRVEPMENPFGPKVLTMSPV